MPRTTLIKKSEKPPHQRSATNEEVGQLQKLDKIMKNKDFRDFISDFEDWTDMKCAFLYIKLYTMVEHEFIQKYEREPVDNEIINIVTGMIKDRDIRYKLIHKSNLLPSVKNKDNKLCLKDKLLDS